MTDARYQRLEQVFQHARTLPPREREIYLDEACRDAPDLRAEADALLRHDSSPVPLFDDRAHGRGAELLARAITAAPDADHAPASPPKFIGRYRIIREISRGGMGIIYEAEQDEPRRRVALKMIRPGLLSESMLKRFRLETRFLGQLRHPGIARAYDAGTFDGQPYLAMELIDGPALLEHAAGAGLSVRDRLELAAGICEAVHHAHESGVIHRDLKPSNILVEQPPPSEVESGRPTAGDQRPQPKILDFGVARATDHDAPAATMHTSAGQLVGTLVYMSPEQVSGSASALDRRSDVYSIGVIVFELLSGRPPYDVCGATLPESARIICEQEPLRLGALDPRFRGDVEAIVGKALEKDRERRYATAADMAADIRRHLADRPILARRPTALYRFRKGLKRRRSLVASGSLALAGSAMLVAGALVADRSRGPSAQKPIILRPESSAAAWLEANPDAEAFAFDQVFPGIDPLPGGPLAEGNAPIVLNLYGGRVTVSAFNASGRPICPVHDCSTLARVSDGWMPPYGRYVMKFEPPITAFYCMLGSMDVDHCVTMEVFSGEQLVGVTISEASTHVADSFGHGFNADRPIDRVEIGYGDKSGVVIGAFRFIAEGKTSLGTVCIPGYGGDHGEDVYYDFACVFSRPPEPRR